MSLEAEKSNAPRPQSTAMRAVGGLGRGIKSVGFLIWRWSILYNNRNLPIDKVYASIWSTSLEEPDVRATLHAAFPDYEVDKLPTDEEDIRRLVREKLPPPPVTLDEKQSLQTEEEQARTLLLLESQRIKLLEESPEEAWTHIPSNLRYTLAAYNAANMEKKLQSLIEENHHTSMGLGSLRRSEKGVRNTFRMWREGFAATVSRKERIGVNVFFLFLVFSACYPDVAAGFLGERSYNQRSIGGRVFTLLQLYFLWRYPYHPFYLMFTWSLERLLGAFVGNTVYALVAVVPAIRKSYHARWFRTMMLVLSICWQIGIQFSLPVRDFVVRLLTRRQMAGFRRQSKTGDIHWPSVDKAINWELVSLQSYTQMRERDSAGKSWEQVPFKVRAERYIRFNTCFRLGRPADQLVSLLKDDMEVVINVYEDYQRSADPLSDNEDAGKGHVEPRSPKLLLVFFDLALFTYVCYSFYSQPFTFNTVVAYSSVVVIKQTIVAFKRYQTPKSARRVFTNMVSTNVLGVLLVSTPVTVNKDILQNDGNMIALTLAMVFATWFLAEPVAPLLLALTEKIVAGCSWISSKFRRTEKDAGEKKSELKK